MVKKLDYQLTEWVNKEKSILFACDQLDYYNTPYRMVQNNLMFAVFTEEPKGGLIT